MNTYKYKETTEKCKKQKYWKIAVGLNQVDNLKPSVLWDDTLLQKIIKNIWQNAKDRVL